jgi:hypothetical protein
MCIAILILAVSIVFSISLFAFIQIILKSTVAYKVGIKNAISSNSVVDLIGTPIKPSFFVGGRVKNGFMKNGFTMLRTKLKGPRESGKLEIFVRRKPDGGVRFETLKFTSQEKVVDILNEILLEKQRLSANNLKEEQNAKQI